MYHVPVTEGGGGSDEDEDVGPPLPPGYTTQVSHALSYMLSVNLKKF